MTTLFSRRFLGRRRSFGAFLLAMLLLLPGCGTSEVSPEEKAKKKALDRPVPVEKLPDKK